MSTKAQIRKLNIAAAIISILIPVVVGILFYMPGLPQINLPFEPTILPKINAVVNGATAIALLIALYYIKNKNVKMHQRAIYVAMGLSLLFLVGYIIYHMITEPTRYGGEGTLRYVYYFFLATHIIFAAVITPFVLFTFVRGYTNQVVKHRKLAKITFPMWMYVSVTGVICYLMLAPYY